MQQQEPGGAADGVRRGDTTDFGALSLDLSLKVEPRSAPNPLHAAPPEMLEQVRKEVREIAAARIRAATE